MAHHTAACCIGGTRPTGEMKHTCMGCACTPACLPACMHRVRAGEGHCARRLGGAGAQRAGHLAHARGAVPR